MSENFTVLDALSQGAFCIDGESLIIYWNRQMEFWSGIGREQAVGHSVYELIPGLNRNFYKLMIRQVLESGTTGIFTYQLHRKLFPYRNLNKRLCIQSQVVRSPRPGRKGENCAVFSLQDIGGLIEQIDATREARDQVLTLVDRMKVTEEELRQANEDLNRAANTDPLTGLLNRRSMMKILTGEEERFRRYRTRYSLLLTDIDHFKNFNDNYGHACGDAILTTLGGLFRSLIRPVDSVCRWGGEEFLFLLPETEGEDALQSAERIRRAVEEYDFDFEERRHRVTLSFGISSCGSGCELNKLIAAADDALYKAKEEGRNRALLYSEIIQ